MLSFAARVAIWSTGSVRKRAGLVLAPSGRLQPQPVCLEQVQGSKSHPLLSMINSFYERNIGSFNIFSIDILIEY